MFGSFSYAMHFGSPHRCPRIFWPIFDSFSNVKWTTVNCDLPNNSLRELLAFSDDSRQFCAYSGRPNRLLADNDEMLAKKIWRLPDVLEQTGLSRSTIYEMISRDEFPHQINLGPRAVGWISDDVMNWINSKICEARRSDSI